MVYAYFVTLSLFVKKANTIFLKKWSPDTSGDHLAGVCLASSVG